jgi:hypothetical protein
MVAGGGGGGGSGGGGGAGGLLSGTTTLSTGSSYTVTVGAGGAVSASTSSIGYSGVNSSFTGLTSAVGGGGGGGYLTGNNGATGGSGGGGGGVAPSAGSAGTSGQGNAGGTSSTSSPGGGGGGAGAVGSNASGVNGGAGGIGLASSITGTSTYYAGGGGGSGYTGGTGGAGGNGGGGKGSDTSTSANGASGTANLGGGGGGGGTGGGLAVGYAGGSGVVIISYAGSPRFTGGTITVSGGNTIHTFTSSGTLSFNIASDYSPAGNNWTANNISLTTGSTYDSMTDVPTLTSATVANYATFSPVIPSNFTLSSGNLNVAGTSEVGAAIATIGMSSGKWYWESTGLTGSNGNHAFGICNSTALGKSEPNATAGFWITNGINGNKFANGGAGAAFMSSYTNNDVIGMAFDADAGTLAYYKNGVSQGTAFTGLTSGPYFAINGYESTVSFTNCINFGQRGFAYTPPANYLALNTYNI